MWQLKNPTAPGKDVLLNFLSHKYGRATITGPRAPHRWQTANSVEHGGISSQAHAADPQPVPLPQRHSAGIAEALRQAAASVAGEWQIISSKSEAAEDDDSGEREEGEGEGGDLVVAVDRSQKTQKPCPHPKNCT